MIRIRTMKHVASSRTIPSFRSCRLSSQPDQASIIDQGRMTMGRAQMRAQDVHRKWRNSV